MTMPDQAGLPRKRVIILISGRGSNMEAILQAIGDGEIAAQVIKVISDREDAPGLQRAREYGIETEVIRPGSESGVFDAELNQALQRLQPDLIALAGFMKILSADLVNRFEGKIINIHPSLLPKYKGLNTHRRVLEAGEAVHGCSTHFVVPELDAGPVIMQALIDVLPDDTEQSLARRVLEREHEIYRQSLALYCDDRLCMQDGLCVLDGETMEQPLYLV